MYQLIICVIGRSIHIRLLALFFDKNVYTSITEIKRLKIHKKRKKKKRKKKNANYAADVTSLSTADNLDITQTIFDPLS